jgi:hypothetical protein
MNPAFLSASNPHVAKIAPHADDLHALVRAIIKHDTVTARASEMMQVAADHPQRYQAAINMAHGAFADGYVSDRYVVGEVADERFACLPLKSVTLEDAMEVLGEEEMIKLVPVDLALCTREMVDAFEACQLTGFRNLFEAVGVANGICKRKPMQPVAQPTQPAAPVARMAQVLV